jgi:hypothetical protein
MDCGNRSRTGPLRLAIANTAVHTDYAAKAQQRNGRSLAQHTLTEGETYEMPDVMLCDRGCRNTYSVCHHSPVDRGPE